MLRFLAIATVVGTTLVLANGSEGAANKGSAGHHSMHSHSGHSFSGHSYNSHYRNWSTWRWDSRYRSYFYFCPTRECYYYWYAPSSCYYPVSYVAQYPPTQVSYQQSAPSVAPVPIQVTNVNTNTLVNGGVAPVGPVGPGPLPKGP